VSRAAFRRDEKALRQMLQRAVPLMVLQYRRDRLLVQQVAAATGFRNEKSFIRAFRAWTGVSPAEFRSAAEK
jgi:AraC-like DNA-binding protein